MELMTNVGAGVFTSSFFHALCLKNRDPARRSKKADDGEVIGGVGNYFPGQSRSFPRASITK